MFKAGLVDNAGWMGTAEGERVLKTTILKICPVYGSDSILCNYTAQPMVSYKPLY